MEVREFSTGWGTTVWFTLDEEIADEGSWSVGENVHPAVRHAPTGPVPLRLAPLPLRAARLTSLDVNFTGFPVAALDFYDDLEMDNTKSFWEAHKTVWKRPSGRSRSRRR